MKKTRYTYEEWANSQLSIAKYYGGININGESYILDYNNCRTTGKGENKKYFPDLVLESEVRKKKVKSIPRKVVNNQIPLL